jgi:hypothetical protein
MLNAHIEELQKAVDVARSQLIKEMVDTVTITTDKLIDREKDFQGKLDVGAQVRVNGMKQLAAALKREIKKL